MLLLPTIALLLKASTEGPVRFWTIATSPIALDAYRVTFGTALVTAVINGIFGLLIAWVLVRYEFPFKKVIDAAVDLPFALPTSVAGLTLATVYSGNGWIGSIVAPDGWINALLAYLHRYIKLDILNTRLDIKIAFTQWGVAIAMLLISLPFVVRTVQPVLTDLEREIEEAAWCLGASKFQTFWRVLLPPIMPAALTGIALGFSRAVGEYGSVVIVSSNTPYKDLIAPVLIFQRLEQYDYAGATVIGAVLLGLSLALLVLINLLQAWGRRYG